MRGDRRISDALTALESQLRDLADELALFVIYERPHRVKERPALAKTFFAERCISDEQLNQMVDAFRSVGAYVEIFDGDQPFLAALTDGRLHHLGRRLLVAYNGLGEGITPGGFEPGRKALIPAACDSYGLICANSDAYACAIGLHRFHSFVVLRALGVAVPPVWHFRQGAGWMGPRPSDGTKVIVKSTYETWSVGITEDSIFRVGHDCEQRVSAIAERIGQPVTVQEFVAGREVCVTIVGCPHPTALPPVEQILEKAPGDPNAVMTLHDNLTDGKVSYVPFDGPPGLIDELSRLSVEVFDILQFQSFGRMDFRIDAAGQPWLTDAGISPGWSTHSSAFHAFAALGFDHSAFLRCVVAASLKDQLARSG